MIHQHFHYQCRGIFTHEAKVLLVCCNSCSQSFLPGGHIDFGESAKQALKRELLEEIGIAFSINNFFGAFEHSWIFHGEKQFEINLVFHLQIENQLTNLPKPIEKNLHFFGTQFQNLMK